MRKPAWIAVSLALPLLSAHAELKALTLEEACREADLVVIGTPQLVTVPPKGRMQEARLVPKEILFGHPPEGSIRFPGRYGPTGLVEGGEESCITYPIRHTGTEEIWCLKAGENGTFEAWHPARIRPLSDRQAVEKALLERLTPDLKILACSKFVSISLPAMRPRDDGKGDSPVGPQNPEAYACKRLAEAGHAAHAVTLELLKHESPVAKAWGCRLAHCTNDRALALIAPLLEDPRAVAVEDPDYPKSLPLGQIALWTVAGFAGKSGQPFSAAEAKAWCEIESTRRK